MSRWNLGMLLLIAVLMFATTVLYSRAANAEPLYRADTGDAKITIHSEPCSVAAVGNLPKRATWEEKGKVFEGCAGQHPMYPILVFYFAEDKSVVVIEQGMFQRVQGT